MFRLYDMKIMKPILPEGIGKYIENEEQIYKKVCSIFEQDKEARLMIMKRENNGDFPYFGIRSLEDFENYKKYYEYSNLLNKSCQELKKEIVDLTEKPKVKKLGVEKK